MKQIKLSINQKKILNEMIKKSLNETIEEIENQKDAINTALKIFQDDLVKVNNEKESIETFISEFPEAIQIMQNTLENLIGKDKVQFSDIRTIDNTKITVYYTADVDPNIFDDSYTEDELSIDITDALQKLNSTNTGLFNRDDMLSCYEAYYTMKDSVIEVHLSVGCETILY